MEAKKPAPVSTYIEYVENFNRTLKVLTRDLGQRYPLDAKVARAQKRIMSAIAIDPLFVINAVGPYLYSYRDQIYKLNEGSESFFLENTFDTELKEGIDAEKVDLVSYIIPKAKECMRTLPPKEMQQYKDLVIALLDDYIEFLAESTQ